MAWIEVPLGSQKTTDKFCGGYLNNVDTNASGGVVTSNFKYRIVCKKTRPIL